MSLRRHRLPVQHRSEWPFSEAGLLVKPPEQFHMRDNVSNFERAKIMIWHEVEVCLDFVGIIGTEADLDQRLARFSGRFRTFIKRMPVGQILTGRVIELPDQRSLPVGPAFVARALAD